MRLKKIARAIAVTMAVIVGAGIGPVIIPGGAALAAVPAGAELTIMVQDGETFREVVVLEGGVEVPDSQLNDYGEGLEYDPETNTLALTNYSGESITGSSLGDFTITVQGFCEIQPSGIKINGNDDDQITINGIDYGTFLLSSINDHGIDVGSADLTINDLWMEAGVSSTSVEAEYPAGGAYVVNVGGKLTVNNSQ